MMQPVRAANSSPFMTINWFSQTAYSSAVRLASVAARHWAIQSEPSWTANSVLVLPCSMASSMSGGLAEEDVACGNQSHGAVGQTQAQGPVRLHTLGQALDRFVVQTRGARAVQPGQTAGPGVQNRLEAHRLPAPPPDGEGLGQDLGGGFDRWGEGEVLAQFFRDRRRSLLGSLGRMGQVDADADGQPEPAGRMRAAFNQDAARLAAVQQDVVLPFDRDQGRRDEDVQQVGDRQGGDEGGLSGLARLT